jgi:transcriptional regulator with XRE-family HTH domain
MLGANIMPTAMDDNPEALLGLRIMTLLHRQQKSVYALAKHAGLPVKTVQRICKGEGKQPSVWTIAAIAHVLGVSMDDLVGLHEDAQAAPSAATPREDAHEEKPLAQRQRPRKAAPVAQKPV